VVTGHNAGGAGHRAIPVRRMQHGLRGAHQGAGLGAAVFALRRGLQLYPAVPRLRHQVVGDISGLPSTFA